MPNREPDFSIHLLYDEDTPPVVLTRVPALAWRQRQARRSQIAIFLAMLLFVFTMAVLLGSHHVAWFSTVVVCLLLGLTFGGTFVVGKAVGIVAVLADLADAKITVKVGDNPSADNDQD